MGERQEHFRTWTQLAMQVANPEALTANGYDDCIVGILLHPDSEELVFLYSADCIVAKLVEDGASWDEATEHFSYNVAGSKGEHHPRYLWDDDLL